MTNNKIILFNPGAANEVDITLRVQFREYNLILIELSATGIMTLRTHLHRYYRERLND